MKAEGLEVFRCKRAWLADLGGVSFEQHYLDTEPSRNRLNVGRKSWTLEG